MLSKRIIPCLDVDNGRVVKGVNFVNIKDAGDPVESAIKYNQQGADELVFLDITATSDNRKTIVNIIRNTAKYCFMPLTVGGGIRTTQDMHEILHNGADKVAINSSAIKNPQLVTLGANDFGTQCIVVAIDAKRNSNFDKKKSWLVYTHGGRKKTEIDAIQWAIEVEKLGAGEILITSMDADGTKSGYDLELLIELSKNVNIPIIASGGAGTLEHLNDALTIGKADAVLAASIFHYNQYTVSDIKNFLHNQNIPIRLI